MGIGYSLKCPTCNYETGVYLGVGFSFKQEYEGIVTYLKDGHCGKEWQEYFARNPGAAVNADREVYQCPKCREIAFAINLSLYQNKYGKKPVYGFWASWGSDRDDFEFVKEYIHRCPKCGEKMNPVTQTITKVGSDCFPCPECGNMLRVVSEICWD